MSGQDRPPAAGAVLRVAGVGLGTLLGAGVLYGPGRVALLAGPAAPLAYLLVGAGIGGLAVGFATLASSPLGDYTGGLYLHLSRVWDSRALGFLAAWPVPLAYVALLALVARWLGALAPLPSAAGSISARVGTDFTVADGPRLLVPGLGGLAGDASAVSVAAAILLAGFAVHLLGARRAGSALAVVAAGVWVVLVAGLLTAFLPGVRGIVIGNLTLAPGSEAAGPLALVPAAGRLALFGFVGFEAVVVAGDAVDAPRRGIPRGLALVVAGTAAMFAIGAVVTLGVLGPERLAFSSVPLADAVGTYLPVGRTRLARGFAVTTGLAAIVALGWPASRTLAGFGEVLPGLGRRTRTGAPVVALAATYGGAGLIVFAGAEPLAGMMVLAGLGATYLAHAASTALLPVIRPALYARCRVRPAPLPLAAAGVAGLVAMLVLLGTVFTRSPATTLSYTNHGQTVITGGLAPFRAPLSSVLPGLVVWELLGGIVYLVARDARESRGIRLAPPADAYLNGTTDSHDPVSGSATGRRKRTGAEVPDEDVGADDADRDDPPG